MYVDCHPYTLFTHHWHHSKSWSLEIECDSVCLFLNSASELAWFFIKSNRPLIWINLRSMEKWSPLKLVTLPSLRVNYSMVCVRRGPGIVCRPLPTCWRNYQFTKIIQHVTEDIPFFSPLGNSQGKNQPDGILKGDRPYLIAPFRDGEKVTFHIPPSANNLRYSKSGLVNCNCRNN